MEYIFIIKIGEIALKGGNINFFERQLRKNIVKKIKPFVKSYKGGRGRFYLETTGISKDDVSNHLQTIFGITSFAICHKCDKNFDNILSMCENIISENKNISTFKIDARRSDKNFIFDSYQINCKVGEHILNKFKNLKVDVKNPDFKLNIEVRENSYIYGNSIKGLGGLPVGVSGHGSLMLSGGIDSPVAGFLMAKRGMKLDAIYFHTYPYTSDEALEKVKKLTQIIAPYCCGISLFTVNFTEIQTLIKQECYQDLTTIISRAVMVIISTHLAKKRNSLALITGEALGQVASQTLESMLATGSFTDLALFRPLIGFDKEEIINISRKIGSYETSILPWIDCCSLFAPKHPQTKPNLEKVKEIIKKLDIDDLIQKAVDSVDIEFFS